MSRFFVEPADIVGKNIYISDRSDLHHLAKVLRASVGDEFDISDGQQWEYRGRLTSLSADEAVLEILDKQKFAREPKLKVTLYQGVPKGSKMEVIIQKNVELGAYAIVPVFMERTIVVEKGNFGKKLDRWQKISDEAVKQCKRGIIPEISPAIDFGHMISRLSEKSHDLILFPYENEEDTSIKDCLRRVVQEAAEGLRKKPDTVAIVIGPEGGFSDKEAAQMDKVGAERVTLGKTILRTETAGLAALAMTMYELEL